MRLKRLPAIFLGLGMLLSIIGWSPSASAAVSCTTSLPIPAQLKLVVNLESKGTYRFWVRQITPASGNQLFVSVDDSCATDIAKNQQSDKLSWSGSNNQAQPLVFTLDKGEHTIVIAGDQTGIGVDKGLLTTDHACIPQDNGENCVAQSKPAGEIVVVDEPTPKLEEESPNRIGIALIIAALIIMAGVISLLTRDYASYSKQLAAAVLGAEIHWKRKLRHALSRATLRNFIANHRSLLIIYGAVLGASSVLLVVGIAVAQADNRSLMFEAETGEVSGQAQRVDDPMASGGAYILFGGSAPVITGSEQTPTTTAPTQNNGGSQGGDDGGSDDGGGGGTPVGECPAFPAFPDENCTGWQHTGLSSLTNCDSRTDNGYIWDDNPNKNFDGCYFSKSLTVQAADVTITRSQVHGVISYHWSNSYSLRNLTLVDVEIEETNVANPGGPAISGNDWSCLRCYVHHTLSGMHFGDNTTIRDSLVRDFHWQDGAHGSGIATGQDHGSNSSIIHNNIQCNRISGPPICSSALSIYPEDDNGDGITVHNVQVEKNLFNVTGAYCVYAVSIAGSNINFVDNYFGKKFYPGCGGYGPVTGYGPAGGQWINNIWADGSGAVDPS